MNRNVQVLAQMIQAVELVIDQCLEGTYVERPDSIRRVLHDARADWQERGLRLSTGRGSGDDHIGATIEDWSDGAFLDVSKRRPSLIPYPATNALIKAMEWVGWLRPRETVRA